MMTTATQTTGFTFSARCKAFSGEGVRENRLMIDRDSLLAWDSAAGHYTSCHCISKAVQKRLIAARTYLVRTDGGLDTVHADSFADACDKLREMLPEAVIADGGWGWVEDHDGYRYEVGEVC